MIALNNIGWTFGSSAFLGHLAGLGCLDTLGSLDALSFPSSFGIGLSAGKSLAWGLQLMIVCDISYIGFYPFKKTRTPAPDANLGTCSAFCAFKVRKRTRGLSRAPFDSTNPRHFDSKSKRDKKALGPTIPMAERLTCLATRYLLVRRLGVRTHQVMRVLGAHVPPGVGAARDTCFIKYGANVLGELE
jgi:hypothetical protein